MKKLILLSIIISSQTLIAQNVGIGTTTPAYRLDLNTGTFAFGNAQYFQRTSFFVFLYDQMNDSIGHDPQNKHENLVL